MIIESAIDGNADFIVTGDSHLLALKTFRGINVTTVEKCSLTCKEKELFNSFA
jgi:predicted nucleic acid-binding protein